MNCEQFKRSYNKFDGASNVIHWKDIETQEYASYSDHTQDCPACRDWFQTEQVKEWGVDAKEFPCIHMAYHSNYRCASHQDAWECPSSLIVFADQYNEYGMPIRDGGNSYWKIDHCPWCGHQLPDSKRELWIQKLRALGYDPFKDFEKIPVEYRSDKWYKDNHFPDLRLV